jgi:hypothetical protein
MRFIISIELGNDAMKDGEDIGYVLRHVASLLEGRSEADLEGYKGKIRDANGNTVGSYKVEG